MNFKIGFANTTPQPCKPDCKIRHAECKFDGTCNLYAEWKELHEAEREAIWKSMEGGFMAQQRKSAVCANARRKKWRDKHR